MADSDEFFGYRTPSDFVLEGNRLRFTSPVKTPYPENNTVHGQWFPAGRSPAAGVSPRSCCRTGTPRLPSTRHFAPGSPSSGSTPCASACPITTSACRPSSKRADYAVSSNVARTVDATRQAVIDTRCCVDWLEQQGFESIGIVGTSLGSCYAYLASVHDPRLKVNVFNHCSTYFADVVWEGLSTQHIRQGLESNVTLEQLREAWDVISPPNYVERYARMGKKPLFMYARYDTTFPTRFSEQVIAKARELGFEHRVVAMPCGHYSLGETPFKFMAGYHICNFLKRNL